MMTIYVLNWEIIEDWQRTKCSPEYENIIMRYQENAEGTEHLEMIFDYTDAEDQMSSFLKFKKLRRR
ncbi:predicted protein [Botrytis cinerea T4]|uniref:Uncharacterized protein n=1 Tax=Botryotinia fuckeliana (strain T4) TaxID=999810 RepID=G2XUT8_BOTF4|nr:predicted protein [Botrytis cinerea T4]